MIYSISIVSVLLKDESQKDICSFPGRYSQPTHTTHTTKQLIKSFLYSMSQFLFLMDDYQASYVRFKEH